ncbi:MAG TPA: PH domain-containing protein [Lacipirellulaceae bacterium]|nr:PH domain-containing protein [Lacipirellulaceae bacterium]
MTCNQCGADAPADAAFCPRCGAKLSSASGASGNRPPKAAHLQAGAGRGTSADVPEDELWSGGYSPKAVIGWYIVAGVLTILAGAGALYADAGSAVWLAIAVGALVVIGCLALYSQYKRMSVHYRLTTHRLVLQTGILSQVDNRILLVDIDDITVREGAIERLFNIGTIILRTTDETTKEESPDRAAPGKGVVIMDGIENPRHVGDIIDESRRAERTRRGVYMMNA